MLEDIEEILVSEEEIEDICTRLGKQISDDYRDSLPIVVGLLKGCVPFMAKLVTKITIPIELGFMKVSSYNGGTKSSLEVKINSDLEVSVDGKDVIIAEDIIDTGYTLKKIVELFKLRGAKSVEICTLLDKPSGRLVKQEPKYVGKKIPDAFVVGFGLDYNELYRNLPFVGVLKEEVYKK